MVSPACRPLWIIQNCYRQQAIFKNSAKFRNDHPVQQMNQHGGYKRTHLLTFWGIRRQAPPNRSTSSVCCSPWRGVFKNCLESRAGLHAVCTVHFMLTRKWHISALHSIYFVFRAVASKHKSRHCNLWNSTKNKRWWQIAFGFKHSSCIHALFRK